jgi:S1-C subfamily serine protease
MKPLAIACQPALALLLASTALGQTGARPADLGALSHTLQNVIAKVSPAVVQVRVTAYGPVTDGITGNSALLGTQRNTGSGVILTPDGFIVTNAHVIEGGRRFVVMLPRPAAAGVPGRSALAPVSQEAAAR